MLPLKMSEPFISYNAREQKIDLYAKSYAGALNNKYWKFCKVPRRYVTYEDSLCEKPRYFEIRWIMES